MVNKPNFFIAGTIKSATTSLYNYLKQHPEIFLSVPKETQYFSTKYNKYPHQGPGDDFLDQKWVKTQEEYAELFTNAGKHKIVGEASVDYLYFFNTAEDIRKSIPGAKIVISLRNPVDRAYSAYLHLVKRNRETLTFEQALLQEEQRIAANYRALWHYKNVGKYYHQVQKYIEVFGEKQVKIFLYEDIITNIQEMLRQILLFLELDPYFIFDTDTKFNTWETKEGSTPGLTRKIFVQMVKPLINEHSFMRLQQRVTGHIIEKPRLKEKTRQNLINYYREDILKLQNLIHRDLTNWLK